jgi:DNA-binding SARP family transcriptional activator/tetratricopeptide (TPR) repeat protein
MLELHLMGNPTFVQDGLLLRPKTKKMLLLLALLALEGRVSRERLAQLFWADSADAKNSLRNALSSLRYQFGETLQSNRTHVWLENIICDAQEILHGSLQAALNAQGTLLEALDVADAPEVEDWLVEARERVLNASLRLLETAPPSQAILERWTRLEPLSETAHQRLMQLLAEAGERTRALEVFAAFKKRLESELGVLPTPETLALADGLQLAPKPTGRVPSLPTLLLESRLVGRVQEFQRLVAAFHASASGLARVVVLQGEPGIGKTRLAQEFLAWAGLRSARTLSARAFEGGGLAYQSIADSLRRVPALETMLSKVWLAELARLLPELLEFDLPPPVLEDALGRSRVFEAVARLGRQLGHVVWFLDDLQWADAASLEVLNFVLRRAALDSQPMLLVLTLRSEALEVVQPWLGSLAVAPEILKLESLSKDETARLLEDIGVDSAVLLEWLFTETGGQPLYIAETLRGLTETGALRQANSGWAVQLEPPQPQIAPGVRAVIESRFARLPVEARLLLEAGAVLGQGFVFADALRVTQLPETVLLDALEACLRARVLLELPSIGLGAVRYAFSHDKLRETALLRLSAPRLQALHRLALERQHGGAAQKAAHAFGARAWQQAVEYSLFAAEDASKTYAWQDAHLHLERARQVLRELPDQIPADAGLTSKRLGEFFDLNSNLHVTLNLFDQNIVLANEALHVARAINDRNLEGQSLMFLADTYGFDDLGKVADLYQQARAIFLETGNQEGLFFLALNNIDVRLGEVAIEQLKALLPQAYALPNDRHIGIFKTIASTAQAIGNWSEAIDYWNMTLEQQDIPRNSDICAYHLENLGFCQTNLGQLTQAVQHGREALKIKRTIDDNKMFIGMAAVYLAYGLLESGATAEALALCEEAYGYRHIALPRMGGEFCFALATVRLEQGLYPEALHLLKEAQSIFAMLPESSFEVLGAAFQNYLESHLCAVYVGLCEWEKAAHHAQKALEIREKYADWRGIHAPKLHHWCEVAALEKVGKVHLAAQVLERLGQVVRVGEPLEVNLALSKGNKIPVPENWVLRRGWLEAQKNYIKPKSVIS